MNRIANAIAKMKLQIADRIASGQTTQEQVDAARSNLDMGFDEYCKFQELKSLAMCEDKLTLDEAQLIYKYLGDSPDVFNGQLAEVKAVLTQLFKELLEAKCAI